MKECMFKNYGELPLFLNADTVAKALGIAISSAYELMQEKNFPTFKVGIVSWLKKKSSVGGSKKSREVAIEIQPLPKERCSEKLFSSAE